MVQGTRLDLYVDLVPDSEGRKVGVSIIPGQVLSARVLSWRMYSSLLMLGARSTHNSMSLGADRPSMVSLLDGQLRTSSVGVILYPSCQPF